MIGLGHRHVRPIYACIQMIVFLFLGKVFRMLVRTIDGHPV